MGALVFGIACLLAFFVPLLCPGLALVTWIYAALAYRRKHRRAHATIGLACTLVGIGLHIWIWRFGHLP